MMRFKAACLTILIIGAIGFEHASATVVVDLCDSYTGINQLVDVPDDVPLSELDRGMEFIKQLRGQSTLSGVVDMLMNPEDGDDTTEAATEYGMGLIPIVGVPVAMGVLLLVIFPFFCIARCCCPHKCCRPSKALDEYSFFSRACPLFFYFVFSIAAVGLALYGIMNMGSFVDACIGGICGAEKNVADIGDMITEIDTAITDMNWKASSFVSSAETALQAAPTVQATYIQVQVDLQAYADGVRVLDPGAYDGSFYTTFADTTESKLSALTTQADPVFASLNNSVTTASETLTSISRSLDSSQSEADTTGNVAITKILQDALVAGAARVNDALVSFDDVTLQVEPLLQYVSIGLYVFYATVFFGFVTGVLSVFVYVSPCAGDDKIGRALFSCNWMLTYIFTIFLFFLGAILLLVAFVLSDVCDEMLRLSADPAVYGNLMGLGGSATEVNFTAIIGNCMDVPPIPVFTTVNIGNFIDTSEFTAGFPTGSLNVDGQTDLSGVGEVITQANTTTVTDTGVPANLIEDALADLNALTAADDNEYTADDCPTVTASTCAPDSENEKSDPTELSNARIALVEANDDVAHAESNIATIQSLAGTLDTSISLLETQSALFGESIVLQAAKLSTLIGDIEALDTVGDCGYIRTDFLVIHDNICVDGLTTLGNISLTMVAVAIMGIPITWLSVILQIRLFGVGASGFVAPEEFVLAHN